jgi:3-deoxy-D-manno-octulosonic-acid transferase
MFGPRHEKFREAVDLINEKGAFSFVSLSDFSEILDDWMSDEPFYLKSAEKATSYIKKNIGATGKILTRIFQEDINTNVS